MDNGELLNLLESPTPSTPRSRRPSRSFRCTTRPRARARPSKRAAVLRRTGADGDGAAACAGEPTTRLDYTLRSRPQPSALHPPHPPHPPCCARSCARRLPRRPLSPLPPHRLATRPHRRLLHQGTSDLPRQDLTNFAAAATPVDRLYTRPTPSYLSPTTFRKSAR